MILKPTEFIRPIHGHQLGPGRGLAGYWPMNEGSGNKVFDLSGNGNHGTFSGSLSWVGAERGAGVNIPGSGHILVNDSQSFTFSAGFAICQRFKTDDIVSGDQRTFAQYDRGTGDGIYIHIESMTSKIQGVCFVGGDAKVCLSDKELSTGRYYDIVFTRNDVGLLTLSIDGVIQADTEILVGEIDSSDPIYIGANWDGVTSLDGTLEYTYVYNRALSASEIDLLYREPFCMFERDM